MLLGDPGSLETMPAEHEVAANPGGIEGGDEIGRLDGEDGVEIGSGCGAEHRSTSV